MNDLQSFWTIVLICAVLLFLIVEVVVIIGGASNIVEMINSLRQTVSDKENQE